jgi:hypothetical protein
VLVPAQSPDAGGAKERAPGLESIEGDGGTEGDGSLIPPVEDRPALRWREGTRTTDTEATGPLVPGAQCLEG